MTRKSTPAKPSSFASRALFELTRQVLSQLDDLSPLNSSLLPEGLRHSDYLAEALLDESDKAQLLSHAYQAGGVLPLLLVGQGLRQIQQQPTVAVLLASVTTDILANKWQRMERYYHSNHRTRIECTRSDEAGSNVYHWHCQRYAREGQPRAAENLLICGVMMGLLTCFGAQNPVCRFDQGPLSEYEITLTDLTIEQVSHKLQRGDNIWLEDEQSLSWQISWRLPGLDHFSEPDQFSEPEPLSKLNLRVGQTALSDTAQCQQENACDVNADKGVIEQMYQLVDLDACHGWTLAETARNLGQSTRTLQRRLQQQGHSFSSVLRSARVQLASHLLAQPGLSIAEVGFCCGFADQAHFQRNFKRVTNITPAHFRNLTADF